MKPQEKQNRGKIKLKKLKTCGTRETVHLREEVRRTASLEVSKAREEEEADQGDQGEEQDPILHAIAVQRENERVHKSVKNGQNVQTEKNGVNYIQKQFAVIFSFLIFCG